MQRPTLAIRASEAIGFNGVGLGIGLTLVRALVEACGRRFEFVFFLPV